MVSVVIPAYNAGPYIKETLDSVLNQTYTNLEIIVVNDGAKDNTQEIVESYVKNYENVRLINKENTGVSDTRNRGIKEAKGKYIAVLDADDVWEPNNLEMKVNFLDEHSDFGWVYCNLKCIDEESNYLYDHPDGRDDDILENILKWEGEVVPGPCSNVVYRAEYSNQVSFDKSFSTAADQDFTLQLAKISKGKCLSERLVSYRVLGNSMSRNIQVMEDDHLGVYRKAKELNLFETKSLERECFARLYKIIGASWWKNGGSKSRGLKFILKSIVKYPPIIKEYL